MPTIFAKMEDSPSSSFCDSVSKSEITGPDCQKGNKEQYIDSIYFALIQLPGTNTCTKFSQVQINYFKETWQR